MATHFAKQAVARTGSSATPADIPILPSKITAPGVPGWALPRPRITKLIAQGRRCHPLTAVIAAAGAGKTMALAMWAATEPGTVAWVCLDEFDNRPGAFWAYVIASLRRAGVALPTALTTTREREAGDVFLLRLASALAAHDPPATLVLDDLHLLTDPTVLDELDYVLQNAGSGLRLVVSARMDPLPLHRYRRAGELTGIGASDLAFTIAETRLLLARHGRTLTAEALEILTRRTEGWTAGVRLAAISMGTHPDPGQFVRDQVTDDSALTSYLVQEVLSTQPPDVREVLLSTSILEHVSAEAATELTGNEQAERILAALAHANAFIQPIGSRCYRYHTLFADVLRLTLRREHPDSMAELHRRAARWYARNAQATNAVRHAAEAGDWPLASTIVIDGLAIGEIIEPRGSPSLAAQFEGMPPGHAWNEPQPHLISAAVALSAGQLESSSAALDVAEGVLRRLPAGQEVACRLAAAMIRLAASRRTGDFMAAAAAAARAEMLVGRVPDDKLARHRQIRARVLSGRGAVELWSGHLDQAARTLGTGAAAAAASGAEHERADCLGLQALAEALRGRLTRAATLAAQATPAAPAGQQQPPVRPTNPAALAALAWVHLEHNELREARSRRKQAQAALAANPDKLTGAVACLVAAYGGLAEGRAAAVAQIVAGARSGWPVPAWLDQKLSTAESRAYTAKGDIPAALAAARRADRDTPVEAAVALAHAWIAAGDAENATRVIAPALAAGSGASERVRLQAWLVGAQLGYRHGDHARARSSLASALRLAEHEQLRLPFVIERAWIWPVLRHDPELAHAHRRLLPPALYHDQLSAPEGTRDQTSVPVIEPLTRREREVLGHMSRLLSTAETAREMRISINTIKTHLKHIHCKLAVTRHAEAVRRARQLELI